MTEQSRFLNLLDVVSLDFLKDLLNRFTEATGVKTLITDNLGKPVTWPDCRHGLFCEFCAQMRANSATNIECEKSDAFGGISAFHAQQAFIYRCPIDFVEVSVPIIINSQYLGSIMMGQIRVEEEEHNSLPRNLAPNIELHCNPELKEIYERTIKSLPLVPLNKLRAYANMLHSVANYIAEISVNTFLKDANSQLNVQIRHNEDHRKELERNLKQRELYNIEMQLKPNYLFNVLNTINNLVLLENPQRASEVISSLSNLMRYNLRNTGQFSTVGEEFESIQNYLTIERLSSNNNISVQTKVDPDCLDALIPPFSMQPLVENAFTHGLESKFEGGLFRLEVVRQGDMIKIVVSDNGRGIPPFKKAQLLALKQSELSNTESFTLINIIKILNHYFENDFSWDVHSFDHQGTTIVINIPYWSKEGGAIPSG